MPAHACGSGPHPKTCARCMHGRTTVCRRTNQEDNAPTNVLTLDDDDYVNKIDDAFTAQQMVS